MIYPPVLRALAALVCFPVFAHAADPVISEFMALNRSTLQDQDGDASDWIEIHNPNPTPTSLDGWYVTDLESNKTKWRFPAVTVPANGYLLVFASSKNRAVAGQELHTNFSLSGGGEYLALVRPDGLTVSTEFDPFPAQEDDVSYGTARAITTISLLTKGSPARAIVPADAALGTTWRDRVFTDTTWTAGTLGVGYFTSAANPNRSGDVGLPVTMQDLATSAYVRIPFTIPSGGPVERLKLLFDYDDGFVAFIDGTHVASSPTAPAVDTLVFDSRANSVRNPGLVDEYDVSAVAAAMTAGTHVLAIHGLNQSLTSSDFFLLPQLTMERSTGGTAGTGYFSAATPGLANGGTDTLLLPQVVAFSRPSGPFTDPFSLALSGAAAGQEIRYTISDPSAQGATLAEPTASSTLYTAAIALSTTSKIIRAAIFDTQTGQKGATQTANYALLETGATANTSNFTSKLPIVVADTHGVAPVDSGTNTYTTSLFHLFEPVDNVARLNSTPTLFSRAGLRVRGSSSGGFPKRNLGMEFWDEQNVDFDQPILGFSDDSDWILNGPYDFDDTFIHNAFIFEVSRRIGRWAPRTRFVEMFTNQNGGKLDYNDYAGVYVLTEKIKSNAGRLDITGIQPNENSGDALTGGYIFKIDRQDSGEVAWKTSTGVPASDWLVLVEPDPDLDTTQQVAYIQSHVGAFDTALQNDRTSAFATRNYRNFIDVPAWIDHHILNSLAYNVDALRLSAFYHKDRNGKIQAGPIWDFDRALGSDDGRDSNPESWVNIEYFFTRDWWGRLFQDPDFVQAWIDRWTELRGVGQPLQTTALHTLADEMGAQIGNDAGRRDALKWPANAATGGIYLNEITAMKTWLGRRMTWLDSRMPARPTSSLQSGVVAPGSTVTLSASTAIRYTLDGTDPRPPGGSSTTTAATYSGPITINETTVLTMRRQFGQVPVFPGSIGVGWSAPERRVYLVNEVFAEAGDLAVSEVNYNPLAPTPAELAAMPGVTAADFEFIEIQNIGTRKVNLFEVAFAEGKPFNTLKLEPRSLAPGAFAVVVKNREAFLLRYGSARAGAIAGQWKEGSLADAGEQIQLRARNGALLLDFTYDDSGDWPGRADGKGAALEYAGATFDKAALETPTNWRSSSEIHGTPGEAGTGPDNRIVINEVLANGSAGYVDAIELFNPGAEAVDLSGWWLSDAGEPETIGSFQQFRIPNGTVLQPGTYRVFTEVDFNPNGAWNPNAAVPGPGEFALSATRGDDLLLIQSSASGVPLKVIDYQSFGATRIGESLGRWPNGTGKLAPMIVRTLLDETAAGTPKPGLGGLNGKPRVGPLLIQEIQHSHPQNPALEFVEIRNPTLNAQSLAGWRLRGGVDFDFAADQTIPAGAYLVIVPFAPSDAPQADAFRNAYGIDTSVQLVGPWSAGDSLNASGRVTLHRALPAPPEEPTFIPRDIEDEGDYKTGGNWPQATGGFSLNRLSSEYGNAATSWKADVPTPGGVGVSYAAWKRFYFPAGGAESGDDSDADLDGLNNFGEYSWGMHPLASDAQGVGGVAFSFSSGGEFLFSFSTPLDRPDARFEAQKSVDLEIWETAPDTVLSIGPNTQSRQVTLPVTDDVPRMFFRVRPFRAP